MSDALRVSNALEEELDRELQRFRSEVQQTNDSEALTELHARYLGKKGSVTKLRGAMGKLGPEERKAFGQAFNTVKDAIDRELGERQTALRDAARRADLLRAEDLTMLPRAWPVGSLNPITQTRRELERVFRGLGFDVEEGPHVEHERYNFDNLNIEADHPARDMQDTFFAKGRGGTKAPLVLRTHTSPVQVRTMLERPPPIRIVCLGTVFRRDDDATHSPMFHQIEGLSVDRGVSMADLKATMIRFVTAFFGTNLDIRLRPSFFPFVEPGAELDMQCPFCKGNGCSTCKSSGWIELGGSGMVHPNVFEACGYDSERYTGWAFGFGIDRMAMLAHGIRDLRLFFEGDVRFLEQFPC